MFSSSFQESTEDLLAHHLGQILRDRSGTPEPTPGQPEQVDLAAVEESLNQDSRSSFAFPFGRQERTKEREYAMVIDGGTLSHALNPDVERLFLALTQMCKSVVCCRATPLQKSHHAFLNIKAFFGWKPSVSMY